MLDSIRQVKLVDERMQRIRIDVLLSAGQLLQGFIGMGIILPSKDRLDGLC